MMFSSMWTERAGDKEGINIDPQSGTQDPTWDQMGVETQEILMTVASAAEDIISDLWKAKATDEKITYRVVVNGSTPDEGRGMLSLTVAEQAPAEEVPAVEPVEPVEPVEGEDEDTTETEGTEVEEKEKDGNSEPTQAS